MTTSVLLSLYPHMVSQIPRYMCVEESQHLRFQMKSWTVENIFHLLIELAQLVNICILLHINMLINLVQFGRQKLLRGRK